MFDPVGLDTSTTGTVAGVHLTDWLFWNSNLPQVDRQESSTRRMKLECALVEQQAKESFCLLRSWLVCLSLTQGFWVERQVSSVMSGCMSAASQ